MTIFKSVAFRAVALGAWVGAGQVLGCGFCDPPQPQESGDYVLTDYSGDPTHAFSPEDKWLFGRIIHIDREAELATIRYTREGTIYEVQFTLVRTWPLP